MTIKKYGFCTIFGKQDRQHLRDRLKQPDACVEIAVRDAILTRNIFVQFEDILLMQSVLKTRAELHTWMVKLGRMDPLDARVELLDVIGISEQEWNTPENAHVRRRIDALLAEFLRKYLTDLNARIARLVGRQSLLESWVKMSS